MLFTDLVCEELRCLYEGIKYEVDGQKYFIQARLVMHILDTKAAEPCMGYQSQSNSNFGCSFCGGITGIHNGSKCVFLGHRNYLPQLHYLRFFGQTGYCCPAGFYDHEKKRQWFVEEKFHNFDIDPKGFKYETFFADSWDVVCRIITRKKALIAENATITDQRNAVDAMMSMPANQRDIDNVFQPCDGDDETRSTIVNFIFHENVQYQWFHTGELRGMQMLVEGWLLIFKRCFHGHDPFNQMEVLHSSPKRLKMPITCGCRCGCVGCPCMTLLQIETWMFSFKLNYYYDHI